MSRRTVRFLVNACFSVASGVALYYFVFTFAYPFWAAVWQDSFFYKAAMIFFIGITGASIGVAIGEAIMNHWWYYNNEDTWI